MSYAALVAGFTTALVIADCIAGRLMQIGPFTLTAGMVAFPITYILTDLVHAQHGTSAAKRMTWIGLSCSMLAYACITLASFAPAPPFGVQPGEYAAVFGYSQRMIAASLAAFVVSQLVDVAVYARLPSGFVGRALGSTAISQAVDTAAFCTFAFVGTMPAEAIVGVAVSNYAAKLAIAVATTPALVVARRAIA